MIGAISETTSTIVAFDATSCTLLLRVDRAGAALRPSLASSTGSVGSLSSSSSRGTRRRRSNLAELAADDASSPRAHDAEQPLAAATSLVRVGGGVLCVSGSTLCSVVRGGEPLLLSSTPSPSVAQLTRDGTHVDYAVDVADLGSESICAVSAWEGSTLISIDSSLTVIE